MQFTTSAFPKLVPHAFVGGAPHKPRAVSGRDFVCVEFRELRDQSLPPAEAVAAQEKAGAVDPDWRWGLARTYAQAGRKDEARNILAKFLGEKPKPTGAWAGWFLAETYTALGEKDEAFRWLEAAYKERHSFLPWLTDNPAYAPLRSDPRFQDLVRRMNLPK